MPVLEALAAAALIAALLYVVDRGMAFHVCLYAAITSGGRFKSEEAYKAMDNPFARGPRLVMLGLITVAVFVVARHGGMGNGWPAVVAVSAVALAYVAVSAVYAFKAFRRTQYGAALADAIEQPRSRDR